MTSQPLPSRRAGRLGMLDALRFVAALSVVAVHLTSQSGPAWGGPVPDDVAPVGAWTMYGALGVPLFFVISGFVLLMTAWDRTVPQFVASRVGRLYPAYWVAVAFSAVLALYVWPEGAAAGRPVTTSQAAVNLTMFQSAFGVPDLDGPYWTLWYELRFYILIAVFMMVGITRRRVLAFATLWPVVGSLAVASGQGFVATLLLPDYAPFFAGGMLLYLIYRDGHDAGTWCLVGFQVVLGVNFSVSHYMTLSDSTPGDPSKVVLGILTVACFAAVAGVTLTGVTRFDARWMTTAGALTYPLYLVHENLGWFTIHLLRGSVPSWVAIAVAAGAAIAASVVIHYLVERPFAGRLRAATERMINRTAHPGNQHSADLAAPRSAVPPQAQPELAPLTRPQVVVGGPDHLIGPVGRRRVGRGGERHSPASTRS